MTLEMPARVRLYFISERAIDGIDTSEIGIETKQTSIFSEGFMYSLISGKVIFCNQYTFLYIRPKAPDFLLAEKN